MLKKDVIRDGQNRVIGSVTTGYAGGSSIVRDAEGRLLGKTSEQFHNTRDERGRLISTTTPDAGLLFGDDDELALARNSHLVVDFHRHTLPLHP